MTGKERKGEERRGEKRVSFQGVELEGRARSSLGSLDSPVADVNRILPRHRSHSIYQQISLQRIGTVSSRMTLLSTGEAGRLSLSFRHSSKSTLFRSDDSSVGVYKQIIIRRSPRVSDGSLLMNEEDEGKPLESS